MLRLDTATYISTQHNPAADPIINFVDDGIEPLLPATDNGGRVTRIGAIAFVVAYAVLAALLLFFFLAV